MEYLAKSVQDINFPHQALLSFPLPLHDRSDSSVCQDYIRVETGDGPQTPRTYVPNSHLPGFILECDKSHGVPFSGSIQGQ